MTIKAKILVQRCEHHRCLYSYKLFFDQDCTATHGKFLSEDDAKIHAEVLAKRIRVNLVWEVNGSVEDVFGVMGNMQPIQQRAESKL